MRSVCALIVLIAVVKSSVKTVESIAEIPSCYVTIQENGPQVVSLLVLVAAASVQLKTLAGNLIMYDMAEAVNLFASTFRVSVKQGFANKMLKF